MKTNTQILLFLKLSLYLIIAWFIFSIQGYLPEIFSFPLPASHQQHKTNLYYTGHSYINDIILKYKLPIVPKNTINELDLFSSNNIKNEYGFYDSNKNKYYIGTENYLTIYNPTTDKYKINKKYQNVYYTPIKYNDSFISLGSSPTINGKQHFVYETPDNLYLYHKEQPLTNVAESKSKNEKIEYIKTPKFKEITEILYKNETEKISLSEYITILSLAKNELIGWYPENKTAVFYYKIQDKSYISKYTIGDDHEITSVPFDNTDLEIGPYDDTHIFARNTKTNIIAIWDFCNDENRIIVESLDYTDLKYRIKDNKKIFFIGLLKDDDYVITYDEETNTSLKYHITNRENSSLLLGKDEAVIITKKTLDTSIQTIKFNNEKGGSNDD